MTTLRPLTGLRAIGAWMVFTTHFADAFGRFGWFGYQVARECHIGVTLFFVLSGFLIAANHRDLELSPASVFSFYGVRFGRIYPLYWLVVISLLLVNGAPNGWFGNLTLLEEITGPNLTAPLRQTWTLPVELCFYFLAPFLFAILDRWSAVKLVSAVYALSALAVIGYCGLRGLPVLDSLKFVARFSFAGRILEFVLGVQLARTDLIRKLCFKGSTAVGSLGILGSLLLLAKWDWLNVRGFNGVFLNNIVLPFFVAILISSLVEKPRSWLARSLGSTPMVVFGKSSYAFYLIHLGIFSTALQGAIEVLPAKTPILFALLNLMAVALWWGFERPIYDGIKAVSQGRFKFRRTRDVQT